MTETHGYWPSYGYKHYVPQAPHPVHLYMGPPHYPPLAAMHLSHPVHHSHLPPIVDHMTHVGPGHDVYSYPHPYQQFEPHHALPPAHEVHHHHYHYHHHHHHHHHGHTLHIRMITVSEDITKVMWIWHVTDEGGTLVKSTTKIHETFTECIADAGRHAEVKIVSEHEDYTKKSWIWHISDHTGRAIKTSAVVHKTLDDCIADVRKHGEPETMAV